MKLGHSTDGVINFIWQGYSLNHINKDAFIKATDRKHRPTSFLPFFNHIFYRTAYLLLHKTYIIIVLFLFLTLFALFGSLRKKINSFSWVIIFIISLSHFLSILVLTLACSVKQISGSEFISFIPRLIVVSEFILYLVIILSATLIITKKPIFLKV
jgi:hypothetical protein